MSEIIGKFLELGVGLEATRGTARTEAEKWVKNVTANIVEQTEQSNDDNSFAVMADSQGRRVTRKWAEGDVEGVLDADSIGYWFYNVLGSISTTGSTVYTHEITADDSTIEHPSLTFIAKDGDVQQLAFPNGMVNTLELTMNTDDYVRFSSSIITGAAEDNTDTPSYESQTDFIGKDVTVKIADTEAGLDTADETKVKEASITFDKGLIVDYVLGNYSPDDIYASQIAIEGSLNKNFIDETFKDLYNGDESKYMEITVTGSQDIGSGDNPEIKILFNKIQVTGWERSGGNDELVTEDVTFKAFYNQDDGQQVKVTLINNTSEYDDDTSF